MWWYMSNIVRGSSPTENASITTISVVVQCVCACSSFRGPSSPIRTSAVSRDFDRAMAYIHTVWLESRSLCCIFDLGPDDVFVLCIWFCIRFCIIFCIRFGNIFINSLQGLRLLRQLIFEPFFLFSQADLTELDPHDLGGIHGHCGGRQPWVDHHHAGTSCGCISIGCSGIFFFNSLTRRSWGFFFWHFGLQEKEKLNFYRVHF